MTPNYYSYSTNTHCWVYVLNCIKDNLMALSREEPYQWFLTWYALEDVVDMLKMRR